MTLSEEQIILDYQTNRQQLESEEDQIREFRHKGEQAVEQTLHDLNIVLRNQEVDVQNMAFIKKEIYKAQEDYENIVNQEMQKCLQKMEDNELDYRKKLEQIK